ncbi:MAG: exonuclease domain-containing protein [Gemmatimonadetes bacterium]|nr:exonuclease domain-containing protein [Gemmatimonadota bacterium]
MSVDFVAVDVETANADVGSVCVVGIVAVQAGRVQDVWERLLDPQVPVSPLNTQVHGITTGDLAGLPRLWEAWSDIEKRLANRIVVSHTMFDRVALTAAAERAGLRMFAARWLDSAGVARRTWPQFAHRGWGLASVAAYLGVRFEHHHAGEDARVAAEIVIRACAITGRSPGDWLASSRS